MRTVKLALRREWSDQPEGAQAAGVGDGVFREIPSAFPLGVGDRSDALPAGRLALDATKTTDARAEQGGHFEGPHTARAGAIPSAGEAHRAAVSEGADRRSMVSWAAPDGVRRDEPGRAGHAALPRGFGPARHSKGAG